MEQIKESFTKQIILSIIFLILGIVSWLSVVAYFIWGLPIGLLFFSFSIRYFAMWKYKKNIPLEIASLLFLLPVLGIIPILLKILKIPQIGFESIILWIFGLAIIFYFFKKAKG